MKPSEISAVVEGMAPVVREYVSKGVDQLNERVLGVESRIDDLAKVVDVSAAVEAAMASFLGAIQKRFEAEAKA